MFLAPDFHMYLEGYSLDEFEAASYTVVGLRPDYTVGYRNGAWSRFASDNGAVELASWNETSITHAFPPPVRAFYEGLFAAVQELNEPADHDYECSSPELFRTFRLRVLPLRNRGLLLLHHLTVEQLHHREVCPPSDARYRDEHGLITQCCHCRRSRRADQPATWDWVPAHLDPGTPHVSHGLCPPCFRHYFPRAAARYDRRGPTPTSA